MDLRFSFYEHYINISCKLLGAAAGFRRRKPSFSSTTREMEYFVAKPIRMLSGITSKKITMRVVVQIASVNTRWLEQEHFGTPVAS